MTRADWLVLMKFPVEWDQLGLLPDELLSIQLQGYEVGNEQASEHDRHGAFQWWLKQEPTAEVLLKLIKLSWLDPDQSMGGYVRSCIQMAHHFSPAVAEVLHRQTERQPDFQADGPKAAI